MSNVVKLNDSGCSGGLLSELPAKKKKLFVVSENTLTVEAFKARQDQLAFDHLGTRKL